MADGNVKELLNNLSAMFAGPSAAYSFPWASQLTQRLASVPTDSNCSRVQIPYPCIYTHIYEYI